MAQRPGFDMGRMSTASKVLLGAGLLFLIDLFLPWQRACFDLGIPGVPGGCVSRNGIAGIGILLLLLTLALLIWEGLQIAGVRINAPAALISAALAAGIVLFTLIKIVVDSEALSFGAWIGIVLALAIAYGGWMRFQESKAATPGTGPGPATGPAGGGGFTT